MPYIFRVKVDGGCRHNGYSNAIGAAAAVFIGRGGRTTTWTRQLPNSSNPTNQRAEITAIIVALQQVLAKYDRLDGYPDLDVIIMSDSQYAIGCMTNWIYKWTSNGWKNAKGNEVANRDLIQEASDLDDRVRELGSVEYQHIPRSQNVGADTACNNLMDEMEDSESDDCSSSDDSYYCY